MKVEIWSDVMCPFCYIGKRRFEKAVDSLGIRDEVEIIYRSFLLDPELATDPNKNVTQHLANKKNISLEEAQKMNEHVTGMAAEEGLNYDLENAVVANSRNAHRLLHFAKSKGKQAAFKEALLKGYFEEGKNIDKMDVLKSIGASVGLDEEELGKVYNSASYTEDVIQDIQRAQQIGVQGVPFFVINEKFALSGAQPTDTFKQALQKVRTA
ncbi:MAG: DsbA family oxidoreductase [Bacteroidota bacterium]